MPPRTTRKSYRLRASDRTMVGTLQPHCLSHQKPQMSSRQQHESAKKENPKSLPTLHGLESRTPICAPSGRRGSFSLDSPLYRTPLSKLTHHAGWEGSTLAPLPARCQNGVNGRNEHGHAETSPLLPVSNIRRADIGRGNARTPSPVASRSQNAELGIALARRPRSTVLRWNRTAGWPEPFSRAGKAGSVRMGRRPFLGPR